MGNDTFNENANKIVEYFASDSFKQLIHISKTIFIVYFVILYICFSVAAYFIFKKEDKKPYLAFIPFYNMYVLFGLIKIPGYLA
ncbi:MAG: hypothetical protein K5666_01020, partial [Bacilli bacterium]|nr:hypothetical protein [Bacilli bacterium]